MKKKWLLLVVVAILSTMMAISAEAQEWGRYPTLDAWRLAGIRNGYEAGYLDGNSGYPENPRYTSQEFIEGYREGYARGRYESSYRNYGYGQSYGSPWGYPRRR